MKTSLTVGVIGAGTMGSGIATVMARAGHRTIVQDVDAGRVEAGIGHVSAFLDKSGKLGKLTTEQVDAAKSGLSGSVALDALAECDVVVEAVFEDLGLKQKLFADLSEICKPDTLFHTNTSTLSVTGIAAGATHPGRVVGTHYCNPAPLMKLVEVVKGQRTEESAYLRTVEFMATLGKTCVTTRDVPGFLVNRFLIPWENNCIRALEAGLASAEDINRAVLNGLRFPMGPFTLLDIVGLDIHRAVSMSLYEQLKDPRFAPPPLVDRMIAAGQLGRKVGQGFFTYEQAGLMGT